MVIQKQPTQLGTTDACEMNKICSIQMLDWEQLSMDHPNPRNLIARRVFITYRYILILLYVCLFFFSRVGCLWITSVKLLKSYLVHSHVIVLHNFITRGPMVLISLTWGGGGGKRQGVGTHPGIARLLIFAMLKFSVRPLLGIFGPPPPPPEKIFWIRA